MAVSPNRPLPYADSILPELNAFRKVLYVPSHAAPIDRMPPRGTTMLAVETMGIGLDKAGCTPAEQLYVFSHATGGMAGDLIALYFVEKRLGAKAMTSVKREYGKHEYTWPMVVRHFQFTNATLLPLTVTAVVNSTKGVGLLPRWFLDMDREPPRPGLWTARIDHYLSSEPFPQNAFERYPAPDPGEIAWDLAGHSDAFSALHSGVDVPIQGDSVSTIVNNVRTSIGPGTQQWRRIPATEMPDWDEFTIRIGTRFVEGLYHMEEWVLQPPAPRTAAPQLYTL